MREQALHPDGTIPQRVNAYVTNQGGFICDSCVQRALGLAQHNQVQQITAALATTSEFDREKGRCPSCDRLKLLTKSLHPTLQQEQKNESTYT